MSLQSIAWYINSLHDAFGTWSFKIFYQKFCLSSPECQQFGLFRCGSIPNFSHPYPALSWSYPVLGPCHPLGQICPLSTHFEPHFSFWSNSYFQKLWLSPFHQNCFAKQFPEMTSCNTWNFLNNAMIQHIPWGWIIDTV